MARLAGPASRKAAIPPSPGGVITAAIVSIPL